MLNIGSANVKKTFDEWSVDQVLKKAYPHFRDYLDTVFKDKQ